MSNAWDPLAAACLGALLGGAIAYLCFTNSGRRLLKRVDATLDRAAEELQRLQNTAAKARCVLEEGRRTLRDVESVTDPVRTDRVNSVRH